MKFNKDLEELKRIRKRVPLVNVSQIDTIWLVSTLQYYMARCLDLEEELQGEIRET